MFYSYELLSLRQKGKLARCWLAATVNDRIFKKMCKSSTVNKINLCELCMEIMNTVQIESNEISKRFSLYLSSQLMYGAAKILFYQTTNLQTQVFQIDKKVLYHEQTKTYEIDTAITNDLKLCNITSVIQDFNDVQSDSTLPVLRDEFNINDKMESMMHDATCLNFGALTPEQLNFLLPNGEDISLEIFERIHITDSNLNSELSDTSTTNKIILPGLEESDLSKHELETEMFISDCDDVLLTNKKYHPTYAKTALPEITIPKLMPEKSTFLTPQKRRSTEKIHIETPTKRRHLKFEDTAVQSNVEIAMISETKEFSVNTTDYSLELQQNLESVNEDLQQIKIKSKRKKLFADKITKLSHKVIKKYISNVSAHTVPLKIIDVNISTSEILFQKAPARFVSTRKNKWNNPLIKLFDVQAVLPSTKKEMLMESGQSLEKSAEFMRLMDKSNKTEELLSVLSSAIGRSVEISKNISSEKNIAISIDELPEVIKFHDSLEFINDEPEKIQSPEISEKLFVPDASTDFSSFSTCLLTKQEVLPLLEIIWHNNEFAAFTDLISPNCYSKLDASFCFTFLLELHKEKRIVLKQVAPYDIIWIKKYTQLV